MPEPWKIAAELMARFYHAKGERWSAFEASDLLRHISVGRDNRWTNREHEDRASQILQRSCFDVDDLAENHLGIRIDFESLEYLDEGVGATVFGCAYPQDRQMVICTRALAYPPLSRATVLHEIAHILMHKGASNRCLMYVPDAHDVAPEEQEANQFMHVALLPKSALRLGIAYVCHLWGINVHLPLASANLARGRFIWRERIFVPLINTLAVSREMIAIKMTKQHCFSSDTLTYHKTYRLSTAWHRANGTEPERIAAPFVSRATGRDAAK